MKSFVINSFLCFRNVINDPGH
ncbi:MAG TPA: hypothetical protein DG048_15790 [Pseudoalteromonas sp.]|nr:hypothetical protein [Pseudoalteromonas sp.]